MKKYYSYISLNIFQNSFKQVIQIQNIRKSIDEIVASLLTEPWERCKI